MARPKLCEEGTTRLHMMLTDKELTAIEAWRSMNGIKSRSAAVRSLINAGPTFLAFATAVRAANSMTRGK